MHVVRTSALSRSIGFLRIEVSRVSKGANKPVAIAVAVVVAIVAIAFMIYNATVLSWG